MVGLICFTLASCRQAGEGAAAGQVTYVIEPPFTDILSVPEKKMIVAERAQRVIFDDGFSVSIPQQAFVDQHGQSVTGEIELALKTYTSAASVLASGIPMHYRGEEGEGMFQSAGMFDIRAFANGQALSLAEGKKLEVGFPTDIKGDYDFFKFETSNNPSEGRWVLESLNENKTARRTQATDSFRLKWNQGDFPELSPFEKVSWYLATPYRNPASEQHKWVLDTKWDAFRLSKPEMGFESPLKSDGIDQDVFSLDFLMDSGTHFSFAKKKAFEVYGLNGTRVARYDAFKADDAIESFRYLSPELVEINTVQGTVLFDWQRNRSFLLEGEYLRSLNNSHTRSLTSLRGSFNEVFLNSLDGEALESFKVADDDWMKERKSGINADVFFTENYVIQSDLNGLRQFDMDGKLIRAFEQVFSRVLWLENDLVLCVSKKGEVSTLDLAQNKFIYPDLKGLNIRDSLVMDGNNYSWYSSRIVRDTVRNMVLLTEAFVNGSVPERNTVLLNYDTNEVVELDFIYTPYSDLEGQDMIFGTNFSDSTIRVFDLRSYRELYRAGLENPVSFFAYGTEMFAGVNKGIEERILINTGPKKKLLDMQGSIVLDFQAYDTTLFSPNFIGDTLVAAYAKDNTYSVWNLDGTLLEQSTVREKYPASYYVGSDGLNTSAGIPKVRKRYAANGKLQYDFAGYEQTVFLRDSMVLQLSENRWFLLKSMELPPNAWQLTLTKGDQEFYTYVYLTEEVTRLMGSYENSFLERVAEETERQMEVDRFTRRYEISSMGLYNCDIVLRVPEGLIFAASFEAEGMELPSSTRLFHVIQRDGIAIGEIDMKRLDLFPLDPNESHRFIAILPRNKIAMFDFEESVEVDWAEVKAKGAYTFKMRMLDQPFEKLTDLENLFSSTVQQ